MEPTTPSREYPLAEHVLRCRNCQMEQKLDYPVGARLRVGQMIVHDESRPEIGRCPRCKHYLMEVIKIPLEETPTSLPPGLHVLPSR